METLIKNVINLWGDKGKAWLNQLPSLIRFLSEYWSLTDIKPTANLNYNYVALATQNNNTPVVLKIGYDKQLIAEEYKALQHFDGRGSIQVLSINTDHNALLLEQAIPGHQLKEHHPVKIKEAIDIYAQVVNELSSHPSIKNHYTHVSQWCEAIDRIQDQRIEKHHLQKAKELKSFLLSSANNEYLCHGDLHLENIIAHGGKWLSIDPQGIIGEMAFEAAAFDLTDKSEWLDPDTLQDKIIARVDYLANALQIDQNRLLAWVFLRIMISAQWCIENNGDPEATLQLASVLYLLLDKKPFHSNKGKKSGSTNAPLFLNKQQATDRSFFHRLDWEASVKACQDNPVFLKDLLPTLYQDLKEHTVPTLAAAYSQRNWTNMRVEIHRCKAIFPYVKIPSLQAALEALSGAVKETPLQLDKISSCYDTVQTELAVVLEECRSFLEAN